MGRKILIKESVLVNLIKKLINEQNYGYPNTELENSVNDKIGQEIINRTYKLASDKNPHDIQIKGIRMFMSTGYFILNVNKINGKDPGKDFYMYYCEGNKIGLYDDSQNIKYENSELDNLFQTKYCRMLKK